MIDLFLLHDPDIAEADRVAVVLEIDRSRLRAFRQRGRVVDCGTSTSLYVLVPLQVEQGWINSNVVSVVDTRQQRVIRTIGLDEPSLGAGDPWGVVCTRDGKSIVNPKNTKSMLPAHQSPPAMSEGVRLTAGAAVRQGLTHILQEEEAVAIDEYLKSLTPVPRPHLIDSQLKPAAQCGKRLFESEQVGCRACHPAPLYTDLKVHPVGTRSPADHEDAFDTPTLFEVWRTAPYLHDGRCATIRELIVAGKHGQGDGRTTDLGQQEVDDLIEFVLSL